MIVLGNDFLNGDFGSDTLDGGDGDDMLWAIILDPGYGENINHLLIGGAGNDTLNTSFGNDTLDGGSGNDSLNESFGNDSLTGWDSNDILNGGSGTNTLIGGDGSNTLIGGAGSDRFLYDISVESEWAAVANDAAAATSGALIAYSSATGNLFYNQNGAADGLGSGSQFATLTNIPGLTAADFQIQA